MSNSDKEFREIIYYTEKEYKALEALLTEACELMRANTLTTGAEDDFLDKPEIKKLRGKE